MSMYCWHVLLHLLLFSGKVERSAPMMGVGGRAPTAQLALQHNNKKSCLDKSIAGAVVLNAPVRL